MPIEIECKVRVESHEPVRASLREAGALYVGRVMETNRIMDRDDRSLARAGCGLRIRSIEVLDGEGPGPTLTFKGPRKPGGAFKRRAEWEVAVDNAAALATILDALGYRDQIVYEKRRETWRLADCQVELDEVPSLGRFVEIEGPDEETIASALAELQLGGAARISESYVGLLAARTGGVCDSPPSIRFN